ncbi:peptidoglycan-binding domain-containing protein [Streptomyces sp. NPDC002643]
MRTKNRIAVLLAAAALPLTGMAGAAPSANAAPRIDDHCAARYWDTSWPPPTVSQGSVDTTTPSAVMLAQCYLNLSMSGDNLDVDGQFGPLSNTATLRFQSCAGLVDDGYVGINTWTGLRTWATSTSYVCDLDL